MPVTWASTARELWAQRRLGLVRGKVSVRSGGGGVRAEMKAADASEQVLGAEVTIKQALTLTEQL